MGWGGGGRVYNYYHYSSLVKQSSSKQTPHMCEDCDKIQSLEQSWTAAAPVHTPAVAAGGYNKPMIPCYSHIVYLVAPQMTSAKMVTATRSITTKMHIFRRDFCCKKRKIRNLKVKLTIYGLTL